MAHKYGVGTKVGYRDPRSLETVFQVVKLLPSEDSADEPRYRIKAAAETFERVAAEGELNPGFQHSFHTRMTESKGSRSR
jgi:hypothetical protein